MCLERGAGCRAEPGPRNLVCLQTRLQFSRYPTPQNALLCPFSNSERRNSFRSFHLLLAGEGGLAFNASSLQPTVAVSLNCCNQRIERFRDSTIYPVFAARGPDDDHKSRILSFTTDSFVSTVSTVSLRFARGCSDERRRSWE